MSMGFYEGVNLSLAYCNNCGHEELNMDICPNCGSSDLTKIERMNGYLSYSRVHGDTRLNDARWLKLQTERVCKQYCGLSQMITHKRKGGNLI